MNDREPHEDAGMLTGGYLKDIPYPHIRKYPEYGKRTVRLTITRYYGVGVHYYPSVSEGSNPLWNRQTHAEVSPTWEGTQHGERVVGWQMSWDDTVGRGRDYSGPRTKSRYLAEQWIREIIKKHFQPEEQYEFSEWGGTEPAWFYKEGD